MKLTIDELMEFIGKVEIVKIEENSDTDIQEFTDYGRWFDESCEGWRDNAVANKMFLSYAQQYFDSLLQVRGHLFLNEVYDYLGIPKTTIGQLVGWVYEDENSHVDFGLDLNNKNEMFMKGKIATAFLTFNVDGIIINRI
ncbi:DUF6353 family protein [[Ruminococcus] lactaris]|uniref:Uncharacterized protein n=1 Tax=[Ruminococcus] lactaris TaxID=46228 RepID=A0A414P867_9FIRM|nr:DUF6353 family protein [[Ruminococcus] lactaris]RHF62342.1 hypothetical protein DW672_03630 [[Ruminococcus] lactaris]